MNTVSDKNVDKHTDFPTIESFIGGTPLVRTQRLMATELRARNNVILMKLEGNNPAGSVKDRAAMSMIQQAEEQGDIQKGDTLIEATSGNTGIALAMVAAIRGYNMVLIMPENASLERRDAMTAYGAKVILVSKEEGMEGARDLALKMQSEGRGKILNQFANLANPLAHYRGTGEEIWADTHGKVTHFVSAMGTTGTIVGTAEVLKEKNKAIQIIGVQPDDDSNIPGIRKWPKEYVPSIFTDKNIDRVMEVTLDEATQTTRALAKEEGIFCGVSSGGAVAKALELAQEVENAVIVCIICDRGDRYLSTGIFNSTD